MLKKKKIIHWSKYLLASLAVWGAGVYVTLFVTFFFVRPEGFHNPTLIRGKVKEKNNQFVIAEYLGCNTQECDWLASKEIHLTRLESDNAFEINETFLASIATPRIERDPQKINPNPEYRALSYEEDREDPWGIDYNATFNYIIVIEGIIILLIAVWLGNDQSKKADV